MLSDCNSYYTVLKIMKVDGGIYSSKLGAVIVMTSETKESARGLTPTENCGNSYESMVSVEAS